MAEATIPVDLTNPGQVFACLGFVEVVNILLGGARGGFDWSEPQARFRLAADGEDNPFGLCLAFIEAAEVASLVPPGCGHTTDRWGVKSAAAEDRVFPCPAPGSPATLPAVLRAGGKEIMLDHWGDATRCDNVKFWAGAGGYPGAALLRDALDLVRGRAVAEGDNPFALDAPQGSSFRFDWRRDYIPLDVGFSPNAHGALVMVGFPLVEILAAIGMAHARPGRVTKLAYRYGVLSASEPLDPIFLRAALTGGASPLPGASYRRFHMALGWPGQEGQARCITDVVEIAESEEGR